MTTDALVCPACKVALAIEPGEVNTMRCPSCSTRYTLVAVNSIAQQSNSSGGTGCLMTLVYLLAIVGLLVSIVFAGCVSGALR